MGLIKPELGLIFWTALVFALLLFILAKYAWKPILNALKEREQSIDDALKAADKAKEEMAALHSDHEKLLNQAKEERNKMLSEAREVKENLIGDAKEKAKQEADKIISDAKKEIQNEKMAALIDLKNKVAQLSIEMAEKVIRKELKDSKEQEELINKLLDDINQE